MDHKVTQPIQTNQRIIIVDVLRGWAILGVVIMNYLDFFTFDRNWETFKPDTLTNVLMYTVSILFAAKSWTLLSLLFGYGFAMLMENLQKKHINPYIFFIKRMFWLFVLAAINSAIFFGDILKDYALLGLVLLLFHKASAKTTFITSIILLISLPFLAAYINTQGSGWAFMPKLFPLYQSSNLLDVLWFGIKGTYVAQMISKPYLYTVHVLMFVCMLWGATLQKINFFSDLNGELKYKEAFWISLLIAIGLSVLANYGKEHKWEMLQYFSFQYLIVISIMLFVASTICWLYVTNKAKGFFDHLAFMGKMTLTNYMTQNLIGLLIFSGIGLGVWNTKPLWFYVLLALLIYKIQIHFSKWWLSKYNYGPIEWIWRQLSYGKWLPIKKIKPV